MSTPPSSPRLNLRRKSWARRLERCCCTTFSYFPLVFVYGLTTWAVWVEVNVSFFDAPAATSSHLSAALGLALYLLANTSYTIAVFTTPGSTLDSRQDWRDRTLFPSSSDYRNNNNNNQQYSALPTHDTSHASPESTLTSVTAKSSTGKPRYCKKCTTTKPDRAHHCSTCGRCVLKMDHHCPWLATCVGLHNYKPFLLFLCYTSLFCWVCFLRAGGWVWSNIGEASRVGGSGDEAWGVVNAILLTVLSGIIGLVLSGFTGWHVYLAVNGQTTIESLEKTRYLGPVRRGLEVQSHGQGRQDGRHYLGQEEEGRYDAAADGEQQQSLLDHLKQTHANALPSILRPEEGEVTPSRSSTPLPPPTSHQQVANISPAHNSLHQNYAALEASRERARYQAYQDELASDALPNAFDLGWRRNLLHVFGDRPWLWPIPVCNSTGDGWAWEVSAKWHAARAEVEREREMRGEGGGGWGGGGFDGPRGRDVRWVAGQGFVNHQPGYVPQNGGGVAEDGDRPMQMQMQPLDRRKAGPPPGRYGGVEDVDSYDTSSDEDARARGGGGVKAAGTANWNDVPDDFLSPRRGANGSGGDGRSRSRGRRKGD